MNRSFIRRSLRECLPAFSRARLRNYRELARFPRPSLSPTSSPIGRRVPRERSRVTDLSSLSLLDYAMFKQTSGLEYTDTLFKRQRGRECFSKIVWCKSGNLTNNSIVTPTCDARYYLHVLSLALLCNTQEKRRKNKSSIYQNNTLSLFPHIFLPFPLSLRS